MVSTPLDLAATRPDSRDRVIDEPRQSGASVPLSLVGFECSLDTATLAELEGANRGLPPAEVERRFTRSPATAEVAVLATCHRIELLVLTTTPDEADQWRSALPLSASRWRVRSGREVVRHLFSVAAGLESLAVGEREVRAQVRAAAGGVRSRHPRPVLRRILTDAAVAAERCGGDESGGRSVASVAADHLRTLVGDSRPRVLIVGAGVVGRQVARSLAPDLDVTIVYHRRPPPPSFLRTVGVNTVGPERLGEAIARADVVVTAAKSGDLGIRIPQLPRDRPLVLVDLGMPRNIDPSVAAWPNVRLLDLGTLRERARPAAGGVPFDGSLADLADRCADRVDALLWEPFVSAIYRSAEELRRSELATAERYLGTLSVAQQAAVDRLTRRIVARLLQPMASRLRAVPPGPSTERARRVAAGLLGLPPLKP